jgi:hypothetical protein
MPPRANSFFAHSETASSVSTSAGEAGGCRMCDARVRSWVWVYCEGYFSILSAPLRGTQTQHQNRRALTWSQRPGSLVPVQRHCCRQLPGSCANTTTRCHVKVPVMQQTACGTPPVTSVKDHPGFDRLHHIRPRGLPLYSRRLSFSRPGLWLSSYRHLRLTDNRPGEPGKPSPARSSPSFSFGQRTLLPHLSRAEAIPRGRPCMKENIAEFQNQK